MSRIPSTTGMPPSESAPWPVCDASPPTASNEAPLRKTLRAGPDTPHAEPIEVVGLWDSDEEARMVGYRIEALRRSGESLADMAVLVRTGDGGPLEALDPELVDGVLAGPVERVERGPPDWGVCDGERIVLTEAGRLLANEVALRLR